MYVLTLILVLAASTVYSVENKCSGGVLSQPDNNQPFYWPPTWNENQTAPHLAGNQYCQWYVQIPTGYYAKLVISGKTGDNSSYFQLTDANGMVYEADHDKVNEPWYFPHPEFQISIHTKSVATFAFKITWESFQDIPTNTFAVGQQPQTAYITQERFAFIYTAVTGISLLAFPENIKNYYTLRSVLVFEGNDWNGRFVNSMYEIHKTHLQWLSGSPTIYIVNVEERDDLDEILVQEAGYTRDINPYQELNCNPSSTCSKTLHGGKSKSGMVYLGNQNQILLDINMDSNATLSVYTGSPNNFGFDQSFTGSTIRSKLPLTFKGSPTQFILSSGKAMFTFKLSN